MAKAPLVHELEFIKLTKNHGEFCRNLQSLGLEAACSDVTEHVYHVCLCWIRLALDHLEDAKSAVQAKRSRSAYSRAYYAAYNASKSVRYIVIGWVSLKGDDHQRASELPDDFPNVDKWTEAVTKLYEHRLRADYDNWASTQEEFSNSAEQCVNLADGFVAECKAYLQTKYGIDL